MELQKLFSCGKDRKLEILYLYHQHGSPKPTQPTIPTLLHQQPETLETSFRVWIKCNLDSKLGL